MKQPIYREVVRYDKNTVIELYQMDDNTYTGFAKINYDTDNEVVGMGENKDKEIAVKLALKHLQKEIKNTQ